MDRRNFGHLGASIGDSLDRRDDVDKDNVNVHNDDLQHGKLNNDFHDAKTKTTESLGGANVSLLSLSL